MLRRCKGLFLIALLAVAAMAFVGCEGDTSSDVGNTSLVSETKEYTDYQSVLDDYTAKLEEASSKLVEEYQNEAADKAGDVTALAELYNSKVTKLAEISNEGIQIMAGLMQESGDEYSVYEEWAGKLQTVYMNEAEKITNVYLDSAA